MSILDPREMPRFMEQVPETPYKRAQKCAQPEQHKTLYQRFVVHLEEQQKHRILNEYARVLKILIDQLQQEKLPATVVTNFQLAGLLKRQKDTTPQTTRQEMFLKKLACHGVPEEKVRVCGVLFPRIEILP